jgi:histone acetyltransferase (RNA polymerase elongator complex component)
MIARYNKDKRMINNSQPVNSTKIPPPSQSNQRVDKENTCPAPMVGRASYYGSAQKSSLKKDEEFMHSGVGKKLAWEDLSQNGR